MTTKIIIGSLITVLICIQQMYDQILGVIA